MSFPVHAITLDLDDTLWPFAPIGARIEQALHAWMERHSPQTAARFPIDRDARTARARRRRASAACARPQPAAPADHRTRAARQRRRHRAGRSRLRDLLRRAQPRRVLSRCARGAAAPVRARADRRAEQRQRRPRRDRHRRTLPLPARRARTRRGQARCQASSTPPARGSASSRDYVLHVGDDVEMDVVGAHRAGLRSCWINRPDDAGGAADWPHATLGASAPTSPSPPSPRWPTGSTRPRIRHDTGTIAA